MEAASNVEYVSLPAKHSRPSSSRGNGIVSLSYGIQGSVVDTEANTSVTFGDHDYRRTPSRTTRGDIAVVKHLLNKLLNLFFFIM